jgi:hypothetical protein
MKLIAYLTAHWQHWLSARNQRWAAWLLVGLGLLPFVVLSMYSHPALDDFSDAVMRQRLSFWETQRDLYLTWTGRYTTSLFLTELSPVCHSWLEGYWLVPVAALCAVLGGLYALVSTVAGRSWSAATRVLAASVLLLLWLHQASSIAEILYWYNGVAVYTLPAALLLLALAVAARYWQAVPGSAAARRWLGLTAVLGVVLVGTNELIALPLCAATGLLMLWEFYRGGPRRYPLLGLVAVLAVALAVSFLAPGNMERAAVINRSVHPLWVAGGTVISSAYLLLNWLSSGVLMAVTVMVLPLLLRLAAAPDMPWQRLARFHPLLLALLLFGLLALAGVPSYWATGGLMPPRGRAMLYLLFVVGWFGLILTALLRWQPAAARYLQGPLVSQYGWAAPVAAGLWGWLLLNLVADHNVRQLRQYMGQGSNNVVVAYRDWLSGSARRYDEQLTQRYELLRRTRQQRLQLPPLAARPATLLYYDISIDSTYWGNQAYAQYFGKRTIWIGPGGEAPPP